VPALHHGPSFPDPPRPCQGRLVCGSPPHRHLKAGERCHLRGEFVRSWGALAAFAALSDFGAAPAASSQAPAAAEPATAQSTPGREERAIAGRSSFPAVRILNLRRGSSSTFPQAGERLPPRAAFRLRTSSSQGSVSPSRSRGFLASPAPSGSLLSPPRKPLQDLGSCPLPTTSTTRSLTDLRAPDGIRSSARPARTGRPGRREHADAAAARVRISVVPTAEDLAE
jgi:hypothetical protein